MPRNKIPAAVESARAKITSASETGSRKPPISFPADSPDAPATEPRRGRPRKQLPPDLREQMPEHSDTAYDNARAQLQDRSEAPGGEAVPPSDYHRGGPRLMPDELRQIIDVYTQSYGPILSLDEAAKVTKLSKQTLRRKVCEGKFSASCYRGTPLRFLTQRLLEEVLG